MNNGFCMRYGKLDKEDQLYAFLKFFGKIKKTMNHPFYCLDVICVSESFIPT